MNIAAFVAEKMAAFDALPEKPTKVHLTEYTEAQWTHASEPIFNFAEACEVNRRLWEELKSRGVQVVFRKPGKLELTFKVGGMHIKGYGTGTIGWAVLQRSGNE